jgi:replication factor C large subunit
MSLPFTEKHRPRSGDEIQGHDQAVKQVREFITNYSRQKKKAILLHGPAGTGKTSLAVALAKEQDLELVEVNASDVRNKASIQETLGVAMQQKSLFGGDKLILFDEVDGLSGTKDRGGISAFTDLLKKSPYPVILTANNPWDKKFNTLRKHSQLIELKTLSYRSVLAVLKKVCEEEQIDADEEALKALARRAGGDIRGALTDLQTLSANKEFTKQDLEVLGVRRQAESTFQALQRILKGSDPQLARQAVDAVDENIDELMLWIDENVPREYTKPNDLVRAMDALSRADIHKGRIMRWQHWRFLVYQIDEMTAGVALAKDEKYSGFTKYQRSRRPLQYWRASSANKKKDAIAHKVAQKTHTSTKRAREDTLPYLSAILAKNKKHSLIDAYELESDEVAWLAKQA